ncbi:NAD(P)-binding domain-containing protein [Halalkalicoccus salilacus]|uniref:NAD(P)-binding domain-containing protein n=1 Tax=Halalkalicoccus sp. GCM10025704 TaxID=3252662 RepID=UPI0036F28E32
MGAGGKMGLRITDQIMDDQVYDVRYVEPAEEGQETLAERGIETSSPDDALQGTEIVILAVPDEFIGMITEDIVPKLDSGTMVILRSGSRLRRWSPRPRGYHVLPDASMSPLFLHGRDRHERRKYRLVRGTRS